MYSLDYRPSATTSSAIKGLGEQYSVLNSVLESEADTTTGMGDAGITTGGDGTAGDEA